MQNNENSFWEIQSVLRPCCCIAQIDLAACLAGVRDRTITSIGTAQFFGENMNVFGKRAQQSQLLPLPHALSAREMETWRMVCCSKWTSKNGTTLAEEDFLQRCLEPIPRRSGGATGSSEFLGRACAAGLEEHAKLSRYCPRTFHVNNATQQMCHSFQLYDVTTTRLEVLSTVLRSKKKEDQCQLWKN